MNYDDFEIVDYSTSTRCPEHGYTESWVYRDKDGYTFEVWGCGCNSPDYEQPALEAGQLAESEPIN